MRLRHCCLSLGLVLTFVPVGVISASPASADCTSAGAATVCAQGTVRGGGPDAPTAGSAGVHEQLLRLGVIVRDGASLGCPGRLRVSIGD